MAKGMLGDLAARFRAAVDEADRLRRDEEAERARRLARGRAARDELLDELEGFARGAGIACVRERAADEARMIWTAGERRVVFEAEPDAASLVVRWSEVVEVPYEGRLYREPALQDRWVLDVRGRVERTPLVEAGLVRLVTRGLGLPDPVDGPAPTPGPPAPSVPDDGGEGAPDLGPRRRL